MPSITRLLEQLADVDFEKRSQGSLNVLASNSDATAFEFAEVASQNHCFGVTDLWALGNSITHSAAASDEDKRYVNLIADRFSWALHNVAEGGGNIADMCYQLLPGYTHANPNYSGSPIAITSTMCTLIEGDFNAMRDFGNVSAYHKHHLHATRAVTAWAAIPDAQKIFAQSDDVVESGTWSDDSRYGGAIARKSSTANDYIEFNVKGKVVYIWMIQEAGDATTFTSGVSGRPGSGGSTFTIAIDGVDTSVAGESNYQAYGNRPAYFNSNPFGTPVADEAVWCYRFANLDDTNHTVRVTINSIGNTPAVSVLACTGIGNVKYQQGQGPWSVLATVLTPTVAGGGTLTSDSLINSAISAFRANQRTVAGQLAGDGLQVLFVDTFSRFDRVTMTGTGTSPTGGDNVHPNDEGHQQIADAHIEAITASLRTPQVPQVDGVVDSAANADAVGGYTASQLAKLAGGNDFTGEQTFAAGSNSTYHGIGEGNPQAQLHITRSGFGNTIPNANFASLLVSSTANDAATTYISVVGGRAANVGHWFGDIDSISQGRIDYDNATNKFQIRTSAIIRVEIDATSVRFDVPVRLPSYLVAALPTTVSAGATAYASNGRKSGEGAASGTGIPVWYDGTNWRTYYDNTVASA